MNSAQLLNSVKTILFVGITSTLGFLGCSGGSSGGGGGGDTGSTNVESPGKFIIKPFGSLLS